MASLNVSVGGGTCPEVRALRGVGITEWRQILEGIPSASVRSKVANILFWDVLSFLDRKSAHEFDELREDCGDADEDEVQACLVAAGYPEWLATLRSRC